MKLIQQYQDYFKWTLIGSALSFISVYASVVAMNLFNVQAGWLRFFPEYFAPFLGIAGLLSAFLYVISLKNKKLRLAWLGVFISFALFAVAASNALDAIVFLAMFFCCVSFVYASMQFPQKARIYSLYGSLIFLLVGYLLKRYHLPGASIFIIVDGFLISFLSIGTLISFLRMKNKNAMVLGGLSSLAIFFGILGLVFKTQHWPGAGLLVIPGVSFYLIGVLSIIFILPNAKLYKWTIEQRSTLYHLIFAPFIFMTLVISVFFVGKRRGSYRNTRASSFRTCV